MRVGPVVVPAILIEDALNLSLIDCDHMVEALSPKRSDNALAVTVLPRRRSRGDDRL